MRLNYPFFFIFFLFFINSTYSYSADCEKPIMPSDAEWNSWIQDIKEEAYTEGISKKTINQELDLITPQKKIILRDRCQPESQITFDEYLYYRVDKSRIMSGKNMMKKYKNELELVANHFNIQPRFIVAVLGLESYYGKNQGKVSTIEAVTTLAFDRRRSDFYKKQLIAALKIIDRDLYSKKLKGSWGGAVGMPQFIPTTFLDSAYDWNKDGNIDIWNDYEDVFASVANYLTSIDKNPWNKNITWGREVIPPKNINQIYDSLKQINPKGCGAVKSRSIEKSLKEWSLLGFKSISDSELPIHINIKARLVAPDGIKGRMFLVYQNYKNILYYNCSSYYAVAIGLLSDEIIN